MELGCAIKTVETDSRVFVIHKKCRIELGFAIIMTDESENKVYAMLLEWQNRG